MEADSSRKRKNKEANSEEDEEAKNNLCGKNEEKIAQKEFDKLTRNFLPQLKHARERFSDLVYVWKQNRYERTKREHILPCVAGLQRVLKDVENYVAHYCGYVQLDQTTGKEIRNQIKLWEKFSDLCAAEREASKEFIDTSIYPKTIMCLRRLNKIDGVIDKIKNDPTLGDPWTKDEIYDDIVLTREDLVCDERMMTRFNILRTLINVGKWDDEEDARAAVAEYSGEKYEDLIKELGDLLNNHRPHVFELLKQMSELGSLIASELKTLADVEAG